MFSRWENGDVWGFYFRDNNGGDLELNGGSDVPDIYFYTGHGTCQNPPAATDADFISVCGNFGAPNRTNIGTQSRWENGAGNLKFCFLDASCPMSSHLAGAELVPCFSRAARSDWSLARA